MVRTFLENLWATQMSLCEELMTEQRRWEKFWNTMVRKGNINLKQGFQEFWLTKATDNYPLIGKKGTFTFMKKIGETYIEELKAYLHSPVIQLITVRIACQVSTSVTCYSNYVHSVSDRTKICSICTTVLHHFHFSVRNLQVVQHIFSNQLPVPRKCFVYTKAYTVHFVASLYVRYVRIRQNP